MYEAFVLCSRRNVSVWKDQGSTELDKKLQETKHQCKKWQDDRVGKITPAFVSLLLTMKILQFQDLSPFLPICLIIEYLELNCQRRTANSQASWRGYYKMKGSSIHF